MATATEEIPVTVGEAAKVLKMDRHHLRERCRAAGILIRWGGGEKRDFVKVMLSEARRALLNDRLPPPGRKAARKARPLPSPSVPIHRDIRF